MHAYEVEIKSLLGTKKQAVKVKKKMAGIDPHTKFLSRNKQLNHYFTGGKLEDLYAHAQNHLKPVQRKKFKGMVGAREFSVRTRNKDGNVFLIVKASVDSTTSANGIARLEFEEKVPLTLAKLDALVLRSGFSYQAKWSREREEYAFNGMNVCIDKNAGYGYLAEFERVVKSHDDVRSARAHIRKVMRLLGVEELKQDRLARMFAHYNKSWRKYYGTTRTFRIA